MSNKNTNTIEINGKRYDAVTGEALFDHEQKSQPNPQVHKISSRKEVVRQVAKHSNRHEPLASNILMRKAVKKPGPSIKRQVKAQGELGLEKQSLASVADRPKYERLVHRSRLVPKSQSISHFTPGTALTPNASFSATVTTATNARRTDGHSADDSSSIHRPRHPESTSELLERAIRESTSHEQKLHKRPRQKHIARHPNVIAGAALALILVSVVSAHNFTGAQLQEASAKAGISAKLPDYKPAGFSQGQLNYSAGVVAAEYSSNSDGRNYTLTQEASSLDSTALRDSFVAPTGANYETIQKGGLTIYIYGNHNATWVNSGIWYIVQSNGALSDQQLVELALSL